MIRRTLAIFLAIGSILLLVLAYRATAHSQLQAVLNRGYLRCGVSNTIGFGANLQNPSVLDGETFYNSAEGMDADFCRGLAAAIFQTSENRVRFKDLDAKTRFEALVNNEVDVLLRISTCTAERETMRQISCGPVMFFDELKFLVASDSGIESIADLDQKPVCVLAGAIQEGVVVRELKERGVAINLLPIQATAQRDERNQLVYAYQEEHHCDAIVGSSPRLLDTQSLLDNPDQYKLIGDKIQFQPMTPYFRDGDDQWRKIINYTIYTPIYAEEEKIFQTDVGNCDGTTNIERDPRYAWLLGTALAENASSLATNLGLKQGALCHILRTVGNYGELYQRNLGEYFPERGPNQIWQPGGQGRLYSPPLLPDIPLPIAEPAPVAQTTVITLGIALDLTGKNSPLGEDMKKGVEIAQQFIVEGWWGNELTIQFEFGDVESDQTVEQAQGQIAFQALIDKQVQAIIGPSLSQQAFVLDPLAEAQGVPVVAATNTHRDIAKIGDYIFRVSSPGENYAQLGVKQAFLKGLKTVALAYADNDAFTRDEARVFQDAIVQYGMTLVLTQTFNTTDTDFIAQATIISNIAPDLVIVSGLQPDGGTG